MATLYIDSRPRYYSSSGHLTMFFQMILKGIPGADDNEARIMLREQGIHCRWWNRVHTITAPEIKERLNERDLDWHLNRYDKKDPTRGGDRFCEHTPFISTTAGIVERDVWRQRNWIMPAFMTALRFATRNFETSGYVYYGYVYTLGKKSVELQEFSEEVRELNIYTGFMPYHDEGEIVAKIFIPAVNLEKYEKYDHVNVLADLRRGQMPTPADIQRNPSYAPPERFANIRGRID